MKNCIKCNAEMADDAGFCPECGAPQTKPEKNAAPTANAEPGAKETLQETGAAAARFAQTFSGEMFTRAGNMLPFEKFAYIGFGMIGVSVILPLISVSLLAPTTSIVAISQMLSFVLLAISVIGAYYVSEEKYNIPISINVGILVTFSVVYFKLYTVVSDITKNANEVMKSNHGLDPFAIGLIQKMADKIFGLGLGVYFLIGGALIVILAAAACRLSRKQQTVNIGNIINEAKIALLEQNEVGGQKIPGFVITIIVLLLLIFIITNIEIFGLKVSAMI